MSMRSWQHQADLEDLDAIEERQRNAAKREADALRGEDVELEE